MTTREYVYRVDSVERVVDGDTYWLRLDVGFRQTQLTEIRLLGFDCPETRQGSAFERREGRHAKETAWWWLDNAVATNALWARTEKDPDDFGRWLGEVWIETSSGAGGSLGVDLAALNLATPWPTRWHETYDPERNKA